MKKVFTGEEQAKDTFISTLVKLFDLERYDVMEKFCDEVEISFSILNERQIKSNEYFEFLNSIKFDLMEECRNYIENNKDKMNFEMQYEDAMDMDVLQKDSNTYLSKLLEESYTIEPSNSEVFSNPVYNTNFYMVYLLVLIINNQLDSARYLYRRLPKPVLNNRTITFIKIFLSFMLKKDVGGALSLLNKEIDIEIKKVGESTEKEEDLIEEEIIEKDDKTVLVKDQGKGKESNEDEDEKMDVYLSDKSSEVSKINNGIREGKNIADNTPEQSSDTIGNVVPQTQVETPEETMRDVDYDREEEEEEDNDDGDDDDDENDSDDDSDDDDDDDNDDDDNENNDDDSDGDNDVKKNVMQLKINQDTLKAADSTMTPVDTHTPLSITETFAASTSSFNTKKTYFKIKRCSLFIKELLVCLLEKTRSRQINLMSKAYDHILIKEAARNLDFSEEKAISYLTNKYGWEVDTVNAMFMPKHEVKENKQEMSINHINTLIDHLIFLEGSDKLLKVERF
ncbi:hypothetical protein PIROE2DRAFT_20018 [Piromyces sp. E2]|nr:hypothetical protein PIROE2DRAFT_20018 [Piromyces sp. E2]|eukprot:OUM67527.1 hypothetical protein PIROE2DRAFT_20018 [Piromyces sp. E2]